MENLRPHPPAKTPRHAATVILLREHGGEVQVLMTQRHSNMKFMGGMWVFPGGALSDADRSDTAMSLLPDIQTISCTRLGTLQGERLGERECLALLVAACRETFEETGLLLVRRHDGSPCSPDDIRRLQLERATVAGNASAFSDLLRREALQLDASRLIYWAHWITPSSAQRRFDTRFFTIAAPDQQAATPDLSEASQVAWMSPGELLAQAASGAMPISRPTIFNLEDLNASIRAHASLARLLAAEATRTVPSIMPKLLQENGGVTIVMPWDARYDSTPGEGLRCERPEAFRNLPSVHPIDRAN